MEFRYMENDSWNNELVTIARRYDFEPLVRKWVNKTMDTDFYDDGDHNHTFCYLCSVSEHEHERTKPRDESQRRKLIPYKNPKARLSSSTSSDRIAAKNSSLSDLISYRFIVRTGTQNDSGTRAQVFLYMYGTENNWTSIHLSSTSTDGFPSGSVRTFCLKGPDIGQLHHLNVNLAGTRSEKEWFLKEIEVTNLKTSTTWLCEFNCWLPKSEEQEIKPTVHRQTDFSLSIYILQIRTGGKPFAGTDSNVHIIVHGSKTTTHRLVLTSNRANLFEQNQLDTFAIVGNDLGDLLEITVESDRSQLATDWDIKEMIMWKIIPNNDHEKIQIYFPFNTWLGKKVSTLKSKRELYPSTDHHFKGPICYQVIVKTGKVTNAGTDANVFIIMYGKCGRTVIHQLHNRLKNNFERNSISEFTIMDIDIGKIERIKIWHDNSGVGSAWFLDSVIIRKKYSTSQIVSNVYTQRLEHISKALYRQIADRSKDRLGSSSRGILRSLTMYDKTSLQKKVTWDENSIGSQDDLLSMSSMQRRPEQKHKRGDDSFDHQIYWISTHNYIENKWKIESIEEINSFHFDQSTRSLLLSDRSVINHQIKTSIHTNDDDGDEIYECQANRWLAKDKEDGKLEVYLSAKLTNINSKKKHQNYVDEKEQRPYELTNPISSEHELLARITNVRAPQRMDISSNQRLKSLTKNIDTLPDYSRSSLTVPLVNSRDSLVKMYPRSIDTSLNQHSQLSRSSSRPKVVAHSNSKTSPQKSIYDRLHNSSYGTTLSDDF